MNKFRQRLVLPSLLALTTAMLLTACNNDNKSSTNKPAITNTTKTPSNLGNSPITYGVRPFYLIDDMTDSVVKTQLQNARHQTPKRSEFSIAHRGATLQFPEHTQESYVAAHYQGAGVQECDVAFTKDHQLVCRHSDADLHTTTNILQTPLANKCTQNFQPATFDSQGKLITPASAKCLTSDITLAEFKTLKGKQDASNPNARTVQEYLVATPSFRTDLYAQNGTLLSFDEALALFKQMGVKVTPELKEPSVTMPHNGYSYDNYRQAVVDSLQKAGFAPQDTILQSFKIDDLHYWIKNNPEYGKTAVFLMDDSNATKTGATFNTQDPNTYKYTFAQLKAMGIQNLAPATWLLVTNQNGKIVPSEFAKQAKAQNLGLIAWTVERSGPLASGGGWYYTGINDIVNNDGDVYELIDVLAKGVGVKGIFSDWPATVTYYANANGL
ncbi:glycerophosphoryl diester phosphodiesterase [Moraxella macacae 0408225]|uniref:glycerophosphodiester phosphodiesterase n=1 Tax=Moraxella macacae 0408225 TaxID=1230338 RepID=L2F4M4_9GAMM|nr:glycerophosphodiester phosphodiesterase family protein [Moraxella macacae]ELA07984.1 glycerophosphoryl diester phosphodiesterase [Moraxella macacae 0408225]